MKTLLRTLIVFCCALVWVEPASAQTWKQITSLHDANWTWVTVSPDGKILVATSLQEGKACTSTNSGLTWITNNINSISLTASSLDGTKWVGATYNTSPGAYLSTNSGVSWQSTSLPAQISMNACSADGNTIIAGNFARISTNAGATWGNNVTGPRGFPLVLNNGQRWMALDSADLYTSTDQGATWTTNSVPASPMSQMASSADGSRLVAVVSDSNNRRPLYSTTNFGETWFKLGAPSNVWREVAVSADGQKIVAVANSASLFTNSGVFFSTDGGINFTNSLPGTSWQAAACSSDGSTLVAVAGGGVVGSVYISRSLPSTKLILERVDSNNVALSWIVPSTNFVLQQSSDLAMTNWVTLMNQPSLDFTNLRQQVALPFTNNSAFYRLRTP